MATTMNKTPIVDVHSHLYPSTWISLLRNRKEVPYIASSPDRLINRTGVPGKPLTASLHDVTTKVSFMNSHGIDISVLSLGNPWLDFLGPDEDAAGIAKALNEEMQDICSRYPGRLFFFACLPLTAPLPDIFSEINSLKQLPYCRGVVMGYKGFGSGLDDPAIMPLLQAIVMANLPIFLHPNYGLPTEVFGPCCGDHGQVLPVSLGFTTETTIAITRMILAGIFDKLPSLQLLLSHAGGTLPFLAGRIEASIQNDKAWEASGRLSIPRKTVWEVLKNNIYLDGIVFDKIPLRAAADAVGVDRVLFGTDHPLFPSLRSDGRYAVFEDCNRATEECFGGGVELDGVMGGNAVRFLKLRSQL